MGSPSLGPTLANAFLCYHEKIQLRNYPSEYKPVNDAFLLLPSKHRIEKFQNDLNPEHKSIIFNNK